jgi:hypothetical protein
MLDEARLYNRALSAAEVAALADAGPAPPSITILSPTGGEVWHVGTTHTIAWSVEGINSVVIRYTSDGGSSYTELVPTMFDTDNRWGAYAWTIPESPSPDCSIVIREYFGAATATSGTFEIAAAADTDSDGMDDDWETAYFGDASRTGAGDYDGDGVVDLAEFEAGTDPTDPADPAPAPPGLQSSSPSPGCVAGVASPSSVLLVAALLLLAKARDERSVARASDRP